MRELDHSQAHVCRIGQQRRLFGFAQKHEVALVVEFGAFVEASFFGDHAQKHHAVRIVAAAFFQALELLVELLAVAGTKQ